MGFDEGDHYLGNTGYIIPVENRSLLPVLNSTVCEWFYQQISPAIQNGYYRFIAQYVTQIPIPRMATDQVKILDLLANAVGFGGNPALEQLLNGLVYELYFPDDLHARGLLLFASTRDAALDRLSGLKGEKLATAAADFTKQNLAPGQPLRVMLSDLQTLDVVRIIEGKA